MQISTDVQLVLEQATFTDRTLTLTGQLDRKLYTEVNKVLEAIGGKWNRSAKAHIFDENVGPMIDDILLTGEYHRIKQDLGQFDTPLELTERVIGIADISPDMAVLEPSVGIGNLALEACRAGAVVTGYEIDSKRLAAAVNRFGDYSEKFHGILGDFLLIPPTPIYDRVVMNPPFANQADIDHVFHATQFVRPGGSLTAIMSASILFRTNTKTRAFRDYVVLHSGTIVEVQSGAFAESGTNVATCIVNIAM